MFNPKNYVPSKKMKMFVDLFFYAITVDEWRKVTDKAKGQMSDYQLEVLYNGWKKALKRRKQG